MRDRAIAHNSQGQLASADYVYSACDNPMTFGSRRECERQSGEFRTPLESCLIVGEYMAT